MKTITTKMLWTFVIINLISIASANAQITCNGNKICVRKCLNVIISNVCTQYQYRCINPNQICHFESNGWIGCSGRICYTGHQQRNIAGEQENYSQSSLEIFPNPIATSAKISFYNETKQKVTFTIFDLNGRLISSIADNIFEEGENEIIWNNETVDNGIYLLRMETENYSENRKIIVAR